MAEQKTAPAPLGRIRRGHEGSRDLVRSGRNGMRDRIPRVRSSGGQKGQILSLLCATAGTIKGLPIRVETVCRSLNQTPFLRGNRVGQVGDAGTLRTRKQARPGSPTRRRRQGVLSISPK